MIPPQTNQKNSSAETADGELQSRAGAKEGGRGGLGGLGGSDWKGGSEDQKKEDWKEEERRGDQHADPVGTRIKF